MHSLGLKTAQGLTFTESFYWDMNDATRAWSKRFSALANKNAMPSMTQAGNYAMVLHYLKAMEALGGNPHDGAKVVAKMKELPTDDPLFGKGPLRADGRRHHPGLSVRGEEAGRVEGSVGLLQADRHDLRGRRRQAARSQRVSAGEEIAICGRPDVKIRPVPIGTNQQGPAWPTSDPSGPKISLLNLRGSM